VNCLNSPSLLLTHTPRRRGALCGEEKKKKKRYIDTDTVKVCGITLYSQCNLIMVENNGSLSTFVIRSRYSRVWLTRKVKNKSEDEVGIVNLINASFRTVSREQRNPYTGVSIEIYYCPVRYYGAAEFLIRNGARRN